MTKIAIYDMDRTITRRATYTPFLLYACLRLAPWRLLFLPFAVAAALLYLLRIISRATLKEWNQWLMLGPHLNPQELKPITAGFARHTREFNVLPGAIDRIQQDKAEGWRVVLATASYRLYVEAIAAELEIGDVIATNSLQGLDSRILAKIDGENCYGPAKLRMVQSWFVNEGIDRAHARVRFYSDHASDAPVLEWADEAFAVNAHDRLRHLARQRGWTIIDWTK